MANSSRSRTGLLLRVHRADGVVDEHYAVAGLTIGRSKANTVVLAGDTSVVSVHHARVDAGEGGLLYLRCPAASTSFEVDGRHCREVSLSAGVRVHIGRAVIECVGGALETSNSDIKNAELKNNLGRNCPYCQSESVPLEGNGPRRCPTCGEEVLPIWPEGQNSEVHLVPATFGSFRAESYVARGGMGIVLKGRVERFTPTQSSPSMGNLPPAMLQDQAEPRTSVVAIKLLPASRRDAASEERFQQEIALLSQIQHPNVVRLLASGVEVDHSFLVMEWIGGGSLKDMLDRAKREKGLIPFDVAIQWFKEAAHGLEAIHNAGVIHRDVKPSNILIGPNNVAQIADLGIAKPITVADRSLTTTG